jgi:hypothetical protein
MRVHRLRLLGTFALATIASLVATAVAYAGDGVGPLPK